MDSCIEGGCHCGALRYALTAPLGAAFVCYCDSCRRLSGGARLAGVPAPLDALTLTGASSVYTYAGGSNVVRLYFCGRCGTHLFAAPLAHPGVAVLRVGTLDDGASIQRVMAVHTEKACAWDLVPSKGSGWGRYYDAVGERPARGTLLAALKAWSSAPGFAVDLARGGRGRQADRLGAGEALALHLHRGAAPRGCGG